MLKKRNLLFFTPKYKIRFEIPTGNPNYFYSFSPAVLRGQFLQTRSQRGPGWWHSSEHHSPEALLSHGERPSWAITDQKHRRPFICSVHIDVQSSKRWWQSQNASSQIPDEYVAAVSELTLQDGFRLMCLSSPNPTTQFVLSPLLWTPLPHPGPTDEGPLPFNPRNLRRTWKPKDGAAPPLKSRKTRSRKANCFLWTARWARGGPLCTFTYFYVTKFIACDSSHRKLSSSPSHKKC